MKNILPDSATFRLTGRVWVEGPTARFLGIGRLELLEHIRATGSISKAAAAMGMSYKRAWDLVQSMNTQATHPLVTTQTGGKSGGGTVVTPEGEQALTEFKAVQERFQAFLAEETRRLRD
jgi:molybdate transport system regulatory protein